MFYIYPNINDVRYNKRLSVPEDDITIINNSNKEIILKKEIVRKGYELQIEDDESLSLLFLIRVNNLQGKKLYGALTDYDGNGIENKKVQLYNIDNNLVNENYTRSDGLFKLYIQDSFYYLKICDIIENKMLIKIRNYE